MAEPTVWSDPGHECVLCPPLRFRFNGMAGLPGEAGVIARDGGFFLIPDVAPLAEGHVLLVTREHHQCAGAFGRDMWERALSWRDRVARLYREAYGDAGLLLLEHGPASAQGAGACIDHAHWHLLPGAHGVRAVVEGQGLPGAPADHAALRTYFRTGRSYLLVEEDGVATVHPGDGVRSQFLRWAVTAGARDGSGHAQEARHGQEARRAREAGHSQESLHSRETWRWQEAFGLPGSRRRFLSTLRNLRAALDAAGAEAGAEAGTEEAHGSDSHQ